MNRSFQFKIAVLFTLAVFSRFFAVAQQTTVLHPVLTLTYDWKIYDTEEEVFLPFIPAIHSSQNTIHLFVHRKSSDSTTYLVLKGVKEKSIFLNHGLIEVACQTDSIALPLLPTHHTVSVFSEIPIQTLLPCYVARKIPYLLTPSFATSITPTMIPQKRILTSELLQERFLLFGFSVVLLMISFSFLTELRFALTSTFNLFGPTIFFRFRQEEENLTGQEYIAFVIAYALMFTYFYLLLSSNIDFRYRVATPLLFAWNWQDGFYTFLFFVGVIVFKFVWINILATLHNKPNLATVHHREFVQTSFTLSFIFMLIGIALVFKGGYDDVGIFSKNLVIILLLKSLLICWKVQKKESLKKIYLFSYFCGTEILPILILAKFLVKI